MRGRDALLAGLRVGLPVILAFAVGALVLLALGKNPINYYAFVFRRGLLSWAGLQETITRSAPLLLIAAGLIVAFRAGIWNLGVDGQFLLAAVVCSALAPWLIGFLPRWPTLILSLLAAAAVGAAWSLIPALLKARYGVNEIITTLMMSFLGVSFANVLIKLVFNDPSTTVPQTRTLPVAERLPRMFDTTIHLGVVIALAAILAVHFVMTRTAFGLKLCVVGANPRAAIHAGLPMARLTFATFALSAALIGMGGAVEILGVHGAAGLPRAVQRYRLGPVRALLRRLADRRRERGAPARCAPLLRAAAGLADAAVPRDRGVSGPCERAARPGGLTGGAWTRSSLPPS